MRGQYSPAKPASARLRGVYARSSGGGMPH
jgi:hypothetical protein